MSPTPTPSGGSSQRPGERVAYLGLALWIGFLGADRLDLAGGAAGVVLTPFLVLTPVLLTLEALRLGVLGARVRSPDRRAAGYTLTLAALLCVVCVSSLVGVDVGTSAKRTAGLLAISSGTLLVALIYVHRSATTRWLAAGAELGLTLALVFDVGCAVHFLSGGTWQPGLGPDFLNLDLSMYAGVIPRLTGQVSDPNRAGLLFLLYIVLIVRGREPGARRRAGVGLGTLLMLFTLSRSAVLAGLAALMMAAVASRRVRVARPLVMGTALVVATVSLLFLASPGIRSEVGRALHPLATRLSVREGSARGHAYLLGRGLDEGTQSVRRASLGLGYGDSFRVLQDVFPGNRYGNFHSLYVTFFAESGIFALLLVLVLLGYPLLRPGPYLPLVAGLWVFNFSYQAGAEPSFWLVLALAWLTSGAGVDAPEPETADAS